MKTIKQEKQVIRDYKLEDKSEIEYFLQEHSIEMKWGKTADCTLLAIEDGKLQGLASCWRNSLHPHRAYLEFFVQEENRRQGLASAFFEEIQNHCYLKDFQVFLSSSQTETQAFVKSLGFKLGRRCFTPLVSQKDLKCISACSSEVISLAAATLEQRQATFSLLFQNYRTCHEAINGLNPGLCLADFQEIVQKGLDEVHSYISLKVGEVISYVLSYRGEQPGRLEIGYVGGKSATQSKNYLPFYQAIVLEDFKEFEQLSLEVDDVDPFAMQFIRLFKLEQDTSYDTYILDEK